MSERELIYVGIDAHKRKCNSVLMDKQGSILDETVYTNTQQGLLTLIERIKAYGETKAVLESAGNSWLKSYEALKKEQIHVTLSNPLKTRAIAEARIKTDKIDARLLAHLLRANLVAESYVPDKQTRARRSLLRLRASIVKTRTEIKNRIHNLLDKYDLQPTCTDLFGKKGLEWLRGLQLEPIDKITHTIHSGCYPILLYCPRIITANRQISKPQTTLHPPQRANRQPPRREFRVWRGWSNSNRQVRS